ncbi:protein of unknown function DUF955 [Alkaliphilus metalliredigens QYMF]|uniref:IrrE N-terminal-like domain-containing protein n=1 Tax=Alkaliphilus metalliredigens (strain QYMF) TaxID=293826 RepID=A6TLL3_ALKMQ|nr:ImmA/IrrE family metallo-endopeptidase [Alkaliphilus metalliredigens]ABR47081.1 protein of unknown function DUF955 [Alkaliphilus metalliredigens QYMF]
MRNFIQKIGLPDEKLRLEIKKLAQEVAMKFYQQPQNDIFDILENMALLVRKPMESKSISGFTAFLEDQFVVFLNSSYTLGHERFSAAHELYHLIYNQDILRREKVIFDNEEEDVRANIFAAEFLMPEDFVKEMFYKLVNVAPEEIEPKHVVKMNTYFKVSYTAMLKRLIQFHLCDPKQYEELRSMSSIDKKEELQKITRNQGYDIHLIEPSMVNQVSKEYLEMVKVNYEKGRISYGRLKHLLEFLGESPEKYGYEEPVQEDYI